MQKVLEYKGFFAEIKYSAEDRVYYGKIDGIGDLVNFESDRVEETEKAFHSAVDDYLNM